jgi:hypothetical protein
MDTPYAARQARDLLATPVRTDADVLARVNAVIDAKERTLQSLWLFFLNGDGLQSEVVVPIDGIPDRPDPQLVSNICYIVAQALSGTGSDGSAVITLSRPGPAELGDTDRHWLSALQHGASAHRAPVRMLCLATPSGVRELGPVAAG